MDTPIVKRSKFLILCAVIASWSIPTAAQMQSDHFVFSCRGRLDTWTKWDSPTDLSTVKLNAMRIYVIEPSSRSLVTVRPELQSSMSVKRCSPVAGCSMMLSGKGVWIVNVDSAASFEGPFLTWALDRKEMYSSEVFEIAGTKLKENFWGSCTQAE